MTVLFDVPLYLLLSSFFMLMNSGNAVFKGHLEPLGNQRQSDETIEILKYSPSSQDFYQRWLRPRKPFIIRGAADHWPATWLWKNDTYLRQEHGDIPFTVEFRKKFSSEFPVRKTVPLKEFLDIYKTEDVYLDSTLPPCKMINELILPTLFHCQEINKKITKIALLFSSGDTSSAFHQDGYENVLVMLSGKKKVLVVDSKHSDLAYGNEFDLLPGVSPVDPLKVNLEKFPKIADMPYKEAVLNEGDILYIPQYWWHYFTSTESPNIAINIWFNQFDYEHLFAESGIREDTHVVEVSNLFDKKVREEPESIECLEEKPSLAKFLKIDPDDPMHAHLRIPKKNAKPDDVTLASGYKMPVMGFGTCCMGEETFGAIKVALEVGYRMFDTAQGYPGVEETLAQALKVTGVPRKDVFMIAKLHPRFLGYESTIAAIEDSLTKLQTDYIDLFLIHTKYCDEYVLICQEGEPKGSWVDSWRAMEHMHQQGKLRSLGVSNFNIADLEKLITMAAVPVSAVENWFDPFHQDRILRSFCAQHNIRFIGYSTLGTQWVFYGGLKENPVLTSELIWDVAAHYEFVTAQVVLRWAIHMNVTVIPRSKNPRNIALNFRALDFNLNPLEIELITNISDYMEEDEEELDDTDAVGSDSEQKTQESASKTEEEGEEEEGTSDVQESSREAEKEEAKSGDEKEASNERKIEEESKEDKIENDEASKVKTEL